MEIKKIHMTYKREIPNFVIDRWKYLNKNYEIKLNLDNDCIEFLKKNFNENIVSIFKNIKKVCTKQIYGDCVNYIQKEEYMQMWI